MSYNVPFTPVDGGCGPTLSVAALAVPIPTLSRPGDATVMLWNTDATITCYAVFGGGSLSTNTVTVPANSVATVKTSGVPLPANKQFPSIIAVPAGAATLWLIAASGTPTVTVNFGYGGT